MSAILAPLPALVRIPTAKVVAASIVQVQFAITMVIFRDNAVEAQIPTAEVVQQESIEMMQMKGAVARQEVGALAM